MSHFAVGTIKQYSDGRIRIKTRESGLIPLSRFNAEISSKVINGGEELQPGSRVMHLDMSSYGERDHDRPENLVVIKCRTTKYKFTGKARILFDPTQVRPATSKLRMAAVG